MEPISSSTSSWPIPLPSAAIPTPSAPEPSEPPLAVGPLYGARVISDAVETSLITIEALADLGIGAKVNELA